MSIKVMQNKERRKEKKAANNKLTFVAQTLVIKMNPVMD